MTTQRGEAAPFEASISTAHAPFPETKRPPDRLSDDWIMVILCCWFLGGIYLDSWAHYNITLIESFFTLWHAVLYSGFLSIVTFLVILSIKNRRRGCPWCSVLPPGYDLALLGVLLFGLGGIADFCWHLVFGFEAGLEILLSPTHLLLALGASLLVSTPLRAAWRRPDTSPQARWASHGPMLCSLTLLLSVFTLITLFAHPFVNLWATPAYHIRWPYAQLFPRNDRLLGEVEAALGIVAILLQAGLLMGTILVALRRFRLPPGALTLLLTLNAALVCSVLVHYFLLPVAVVTGLAADGLLLLLKPSLAHPGALRLFAFVVPTLLYGLYFLDLLLTQGVWWSVHLWAGTILLAGVVGLLLSFVFQSPAPTRGLTENKR
jgi:hypothetical protein